MFFFKKNKLTIVVVSYNMELEVLNTLYSLFPPYQQNIDFKYDVIVLDHGSTTKMDVTKIKRISKKILYKYIDTKAISPLKAINGEIKKIKTEYVMCCIDGARILSPNILSLAMEALRTKKHPFVYTIAMHIGSDVQKNLLLNGYTKQDEIKLLKQSNWKKDGYKLFNISVLAPSSNKGYFSDLVETNCFLMRVNDFFKIGGFNEKFVSAGGGFGNIEFFQRAVTSQNIDPIVLLGEATFHQMHGGAITNEIINREEKMQIANEEYRKITLKENAGVVPYFKTYYGTLDKKIHKKAIDCE